MRLMRICMVHGGGSDPSKRILQRLVRLRMYHPFEEYLRQDFFIG
jgi:hypothetical protein